MFVPREYKPGLSQDALLPIHIFALCLHLAEKARDGESAESTDGHESAVEGLGACAAQVPHAHPFL